MTRALPSIYILKQKRVIYKGKKKKTKKPLENYKP